MLFSKWGRLRLMRKFGVGRSIYIPKRSANTIGIQNQQSLFAFEGFEMDTTVDAPREWVESITMLRLPEHADLGTTAIQRISERARRYCDHLANGCQNRPFKRLCLEDIEDSLPKSRSRNRRFHLDLVFAQGGG
jgi:hypothetical protein